VHAGASTLEETDWSQIVVLYDRLLVEAPTAVLALGRAIAIGEVEGPTAALALDRVPPGVAAGPTVRVISLGEQDRNRWDRDLIDDAGRARGVRPARVAAPSVTRIRARRIAS
jgi:predicted RNA polymerase sigma factor